MHQSVATINSPEFLNLQPLDINPLMSKCEIKVLYLGANRNHSFITKEVATEIGKTLRGAPIVGYYKEDKEDCVGHGEKVILDDEGVHFETLTKPYGFVSPVAEVWFQDFEDSDGMGNTIIRTYLMTTGFLWTGQFTEASLAVKEGRPQSMQLDPETLNGTWETNIENKMEFFIINDAIISKLCILGDDVEPCFEGASITAPNVSSTFTLDENFKHTLFSMMQDLKNALKEGGQQMEDLKETEVTENEVSSTEVENFSETQDKVDKVNTLNNDNNTEEVEVSNNFSVENNIDNSSSTETQENYEEKYNKLTQDFNELKNCYTAIQEQCESRTNQLKLFIEFKRIVDNKEKDALIAEFYMLSDSDKAEIVENKEKYSLEQIKAKLSVICFDKKISFTKNEEKTEDNTLIYNLNTNNDDGKNLPDWVKAVKEQEKNN